LSKISFKRGGGGIDNCRYNNNIHNYIKSKQSTKPNKYLGVRLGRVQIDLDTPPAEAGQQGVVAAAGGPAGHGAQTREPLERAVSSRRGGRLVAVAPQTG
jgi:hypothetical protein